MTEIPEHLLKRSKAAKAKAAGEEPAEDAAPSTDVAPVADAAPVAASAPLPDVLAEPEPVKPVAPYVQQAVERKTMPFWIIPVLLALPVWGAMYVGTLERVPQGLTGLLGHGEELYVESGCSGCHGAEGDGGIGFKLSEGEVHISFTSVEDQVVWIAKGSAVTGNTAPYTSADSARPRSVAGQMPGFAPEGGNSSRRLDAEELLSVTLFERTQFEPGGEAQQDLALANALNEILEAEPELLDLPEEYDAATLTAADVTEWLAPARAKLAELEG